MALDRGTKHPGRMGKDTPSGLASGVDTDSGHPPGDANPLHLPLGCLASCFPVQAQGTQLLAEGHLCPETEPPKLPPADPGSESRAHVPPEPTPPPFLPHPL